MGVVMKRSWLPVAVLSFAVVLSACTREPIHKAVAGSLIPAEENLVVSNHCQGCHVHSKFKAEAHLEKVRDLYAQDNPLRENTQCLKCHDLKLENIFRNEVRHTEFPHKNLVGKADIPKPAAVVQAPDKKEMPKTEAEQNKRKWYFFYLF